MSNRGNFRKILSWPEIHQTLKQQDNKRNITVERNGKVLIFPIIWGTDSKDRLGIAMLESKKEYSITDSIVAGWNRTWQLGGLTLGFLGELITGQRGTKDLGGPIMIAKTLGQAAQKSFYHILFLMAFISLQLGIFNLLPIPALDGGHIFLLILEKIKGAPLSAKFRQRSQIVGFSLLMLLMIFITIQDGIRLFS